MMLPIPQLVFYLFSSLVVLSGAMVVFSRNPVRGALFLVASFVASSVLWLLMEAEFLALALVFVYVGAVMTLFLFVVMMLNLATLPTRKGWLYYMPIGFLVVGALVAIMMWVLAPAHFGVTQFPIPKMQGAHYSNVKELGSVLYTQYMYAFEVAAVILLVSIVAAIALAFRGRQHRKAQKMGEQVRATKDSRLRIVSMKSERA